MDKKTKEILRVTRFVGQKTVPVSSAAKAGFVLLGDPQEGTLAVPNALVAKLAEAGLVQRAGNGLLLTAAGRAFAAERRRDGAVLPEGFGELSLSSEPADGKEIRLENLSESPLALLARRRTVDGKPFLKPCEISAGERLRSDYTRGQIMPRLGANWVATVASGRRGGGNGVVELTDAALAARLRVEKAVVAVGPELSGVLIDICCYLKGLERVEAERGWPARSAKIVLKSGLGALSRHYDPKAGSSARHILHWGAEDFRPRLE